jgi:DNA-binding transcriptional LysR family regulator
MRSFRESRELLVASGAYLDRAGRPEHPDQLAQRDTLGFAPEVERQTWELYDRQCQAVRVEVTPRLVCHDFNMLRAAAQAGLGIALLPESVVQADVAGGKLERVLPDWGLPLGILHVVFPSRRGLLPSVRAFIDFLAERLPSAI